MIHYFLNIGSNLGNRKLNISRALRELEKRYGYFETSSIMDSTPWGYESQNEFSNIAVMIISPKPPREVLKDIKEIEDIINKSAHRTPDGAYADRELDIDIMAADDIMIDEPDLTVPHKHLSQRDFFLKPMAELAPTWRNPVNGLTCDEMLAFLETSSE